VAAAALISVLAEADSKFVGTGLRDTTRVASGDVDIWCDILLTNRDAFLKAIDGYEHWVDEFRRAVESADRDKLSKLLAAAKQKRDSLWHE
jgi:prephenate dehydrogenase